MTENPNLNVGHLRAKAFKKHNNKATSQCSHSVFSTKYIHWMQKYIQTLNRFLPHKIFSTYDSLHFGNGGKAQSHKYEWNLAETRSHLGFYCTEDYTDKENNTESKYVSINPVL